MHVWFINVWGCVETFYFALILCAIMCYIKINKNAWKSIYYWVIQKLNTRIICNSCSFLISQNLLYSTDSATSSDLVKKVTFLHRSLEKRELFLLEKEKEFNKKLKLLGITKSENAFRREDSQIPTIYFITPTYKRLTQKADLTRLSQTLLHIPKLHWILVEDSNEKTDLVKRFLANCGVSYTHLNVRTPKQLITKEGDPRWLKARGVEQRNLALRWIRQSFKDGMEGVVYFGDDDNTYDLKIFEQVSCWQK